MPINHESTLWIVFIHRPKSHSQYVFRTRKAAREFAKTKDVHPQNIVGIQRAKWGPEQ